VQNGFDNASILERAHFCRLPFLTRGDLSAQLARIVRRLEDPTALFRYSRGLTSGTSGIPVLVFFDKKACVQSYGNFLLFMANNGLMLTRRAITVLGVIEFEGRPSYFYRSRHLNGGYYYRLNIASANWRDPEALLEYIAHVRPTIIEGRPSPLTMLADMLSRHRGEAGFSPDAVVSFGEPLDADVRRRLTSVYGAAVYNHYGLTELGGGVALECNRHDGLHVFAESFIVEVVDAEGRPLRDGETGEIVITSLLNRIMPIIRYRTGDRGYLSPLACPCGVQYPVLHLVEGRVVNLFVDSDGALHNPYPLGILMECLPISQYQIIQEELKCILIRYVPKAEIRPEMWQGVESRVREMLGSDVRVRREAISAFEKREKSLQKFLCRVHSQDEE